jgi:RsiW-degrading membrane proteinase PrsW (M82 family)
LGTQLQQKLLELHASMQAEADQASTAALAAQLADVANARQQVVALAQARSPIQWASPVVSIVVTLGFFVVLWLLLSGRTADLPAPVMQIVTMIVGTLVAGFATVINFWLGSSQGSKSKDGTIAAAQTALANSTPTPQQ